MASAAADTSAIDATAAAASGVDARAKKPVWNVPSNGSIEVGAVMGAVSWPALSESTKPSSKSLSSSDSLKSLSEGTLSSPSPKPTTTAPNPNPVQNPAPLGRQKSGKRANGGFAPPPPPPISTTEVSRNAPDKQAFPEPSPRGAKSGGPEQHRGYGGNRRGNSHSGGSHQGHGNRRDQDWSHHPRGAHVQQPRGGGIRSYPRGVHMQAPPPPPPPVSAPFIGPPPPPPVRPFVGNAMSFPDMPSPLYFVSPPPPPEPLRGVPFVPQPIPHAMFFPPMDPQRAQLLKQIDYYFSSENLCKDVFLRQNMDDQGWVPISLIAGFNRVKQLTNNMQYILDTVQLSTIVEIQGDKIRRRNDWMNWLLLPFNHFGPQSLPTADYDGVATRMQNIGLEGAATNHNSIKGPIRGEVFLTRSAFGSLNNQVQVIRDPSVDGNGQFAGFTDSEKTQSTTRSLARSDTL